MAALAANLGPMRSEPPDEETYGRVTNPERFEPLVVAAKELVDYLVMTFDVVRFAGTAATDFPNWPEESAETVRLVPSRGVPLVVMFTDFPGLMVRVGEWGDLPGFPSCGCDACAESAEECIEEFARLVTTAVNGDYTESLTKRELRYGYRGHWGSRNSRRPLRHREWKQYGEPGAHSWPPWSRRDA